MQTLNLSDGKTISGYVGATNAQLQILSVPTQFLLMFPAFLTDFSQTFDATWNTEEVFGRMDPIATYQGTKRTISLGFDLPAGSSKEAKINLEGCSKLVKMVYPVYNKQDILVKPPLVRIQFANLIKSDIGIDHDGDESTKTEGDKKTTPKVFGLLGWISGLSWKPNLEMGMFTTGEELYPKVVSLSFSFNVLHEKTPSQEIKEMFPFGG
jgi:hypothetical protein